MASQELNELINQATQKVAEQLGKLVNDSISVISSNAEEVKIEDLNKVIFSYVKPVIIYSSLSGGKVHGVSLTILEKKEALFLAAFLTGNKDLKFLGEKETSALRETSNVVSGTYANVLATGIKETIASTQPLIVNTDDIDDVKKDLIKVKEKGDKLLLLKSKFKIQKQNINIGLFLFFNKDIINN